jgi:serine protease Do
MKKALSIIGISVASTLITLALYSHYMVHPQAEIIQAEAAPTPSRVNYSPPFDANFVTAAEMTVNAVVHVKTSFQQTSAPTNPFELFFGNPNGRPQIVQGTGSGVIISSDGYIITNNHVIDKAQNISITLNDEREYKAEVIGRDPETDLALVKISAKELPFLNFSNSDEVRVGEWVLAVGNPFNLTSTVTAGIVSAKGRSIGIIPDRAAIESFIQTDAAVNPGNSGGALVNTAGDLIGINTAISTHTGSFEGYSFAVPSNIVRKVVEDIRKYGAVQRAFLGVNIGTVTPRIVEELGLKVTSGVLIGGVNENGAAAEAGLKQGDVIVSVDGKSIGKASELQELIGRKRPGEKVSIGINRDGKSNSYSLTLRNRQGTTQILQKEDLDFNQMLGAQFENLSTDEKERFGLNQGIKVSKVKGGKFAKAGIPEGFIITKVNNRFVSGPEELENLFNKLQSGDGVLLQGYLPNGRPDYYAFGW